MNTLAPVRTVAPTTDLLSLEEIKQHCRVDGNDEDEFLKIARAAATDHLDGWSGVLGRCLLSQTWRLDLGGFPDDARLRLPLLPVSAVSSITYRDVADAQQTLATSVYAGPFVDALGAYVKLKSGQVWPGTYDRDDAVAVTFVAGYGASAEAVPGPLRRAALLIVGDIYANRETVVIGASVSEIPMSAAVDALIAPYRRIGI